MSVELAVLLLASISAIVADIMTSDEEVERVLSDIVIFDNASAVTDFKASVPARFVAKTTSASFAY